ncbi:MAG: formylglycine-generating enzyme family protein [Nitrospiraceae bacterium]
MRRVAVIMTFLAGLMALSVAAPARTETRRGLEAEARKHGAPMAWIKDGAFTMGSQDGLSKTQPPHEVYLNAFYMDQYEVTTARYAKFLEATGQDQPRPLPMLWEQINLPDDGDRPVTGVTWVAADAYCRWVSKRLPTEAEWEKAARGADGRTYPWGNEEPTFKLANYDKPVGPNFYSNSLRPVDSYEAGKSPYGLYDMAGSVSEWVADWYDEKYYVTSPKSNPTGPARGQQKVLRGGSFGDPAIQLKSASRESYFPTDKGPYVGIRCAQDAF